MTHRVVRILSTSLQLTDIRNRTADHTIADVYDSQLSGIRIVSQIPLNTIYLTHVAQIATHVGCGNGGTSNFQGFTCKDEIATAELHGMAAFGLRSKPRGCHRLKVSLAAHVHACTDHLSPNKKWRVGWTGHAGSNLDAWLTASAAQVL